MAAAAWVKPNPLLLDLLRSAGAEKETFTMKEVIHHLGQYIMAKQLYDQKQQHIVHCWNDPLGELFGVQNFSVKEPRTLYAMISRNVGAADSQDTLEKAASSVPQSVSAVQDSAEGLQKRPPSAPSPKKGRSDSEENSSNGRPSEPPRKRQKSDSVSLPFDESPPWWAISDLHGDSTDPSSNTDPEERSVNNSDCSDEDSDCDEFSVEFEVESVHSEDYGPSEESITEEEEEAYQVTIYETEESRDSPDEDTEASEADYWKCSNCDEMNPPLPTHCKRCWSPHKDRLPNQTEMGNCSVRREEMEDFLEDEGIDVPEGEKPKRTESQESIVMKRDDEEVQGPESQETEDYSQPSTSGSKEGEQAHQESSEQGLPLSSVELCVICQTRPKNGCIVHGRTGHLMACFSCAKKLKKRNKPCPVCRQPIQRIVQTYFS